MNSSNHLFEHFEQMESIEPSPDWNDRLLSKIEQSVEKKEDHYFSRLVLIAIFLLLILNVFSLSKSYLREKSQMEMADMKRIASEYLISTNSSKY